MPLFLFRFDLLKSRVKTYVDIVFRFYSSCGLLFRDFQGLLVPLLSRLHYHLNRECAQARDKNDCEPDLGEEDVEDDAKEAASQEKRINHSDRVKVDLSFRWYLWVPSPSRKEYEAKECRLKDDRSRNRDGFLATEMKHAHSYRYDKRSSTHAYD